MNDTPLNNEADFDDATHERLGAYVYALRDPRDRKIFYVGKAGGSKGTGNQRVLAHFDEARSAGVDLQSLPSPKVRRIQEIWAADEKVDWFVIRHGLPDEATAFHVEAALIDLLEISQNGPALNRVRGSNVAKHGMLAASDVRALATPPVKGLSDKLKDRPVFVFPVHNALAQGRDVYEATRKSWIVGPDFRSLEGALAVGVANGRSRGVFAIEQWVPSEGRWAFIGRPVDEPELHERNYLAVQARAMGYLMRGNFVVVSFDGQGGFRFLRGNADKNTVFPL